MDNSEIEFRARLGIHEFLLELVLTNMCRRFPDPNSFEGFRREVIDQVQYKGLSQGGAFDLQIQSESVAIVEKFFDKVSARMKNIPEEN